MSTPLWKVSSAVRAVSGGHWTLGTEQSVSARFAMGPSLGNGVHILVSDVWRVSSAVRPVSRGHWTLDTGQSTVCPRGLQRQKRSQSLDNGRLCRATQLSVVFSKSQPVTTLY